MAKRNSSLNIGVIGEDSSDVDVIEAIIEKYTSRDAFKIRSFRAGGCGKIISKCFPWAKDLANRGCTRLIVCIDLDKNGLDELRSSIAEKLETCPIVLRLIVIPVIEMEAWLLSDIKAIIESFSLTRSSRQISDTESIKDPKKKIEELVYNLSYKKRRYVSTVHNKGIANKARLECLLNCNSYKPLDLFIREHIVSGRVGGR